MSDEKQLSIVERWQMDENGVGAPSGYQPEPGRETPGEAIKRKQREQEECKQKQEQD